MLAFFWPIAMIRPAPEHASRSEHPALFVDHYRSGGSPFGERGGGPDGETDRATFGQPTPGGDHSSPDKTPGDADHSKVMQSEDKPGEKDHAPSERPASDAEKLALLRPPAAEPAHQRSPAPAQDQTGARTGAARSQTTAPAQEGQKAQAESKQSEANPDVVNSENGRFTVPGPRQAMV